MKADMKQDRCTLTAFKFIILDLVIKEPEKLIPTMQYQPSVSRNTALLLQDQIHRQAQPFHKSAFYPYCQDPPDTQGRRKFWKPLSPRGWL